MRAKPGLPVQPLALQELRLADWMALKAARREAFACGVPGLDTYFHRLAVQQSAKGLASVFVLVEQPRPEVAIGFYALSAAQVEAAHLPAALAKRLPRYPIPCFRMGRLACHVSHQGQGLGAVLLGLAVSRCRQAMQSVGAVVLIVDAKDTQAAGFYAHHGFSAASDAPLSLFLKL